MIHKTSNGFIEVIVGPMFSGKSEELIRRTKLLNYAKIKYQVFKPLVDNRWSESEVASRAGSKIGAMSIPGSKDIIFKLKKDSEAIIIDEAQFFDKGLIEVVESLANSGKRIIVAGLDTDFMDNPFGPIPEILSKAEFVTKLQGICMQCGNWGTKTQRISNSTKQVVVGDTDSYEVRCRKCHKYPSK